MSQPLTQLRIDLEVVREHLIPAIRRAQTVHFDEPKALDPAAHLGDIRDRIDWVIDQLWMAERGVEAVA